MIVTAKNFGDGTGDRADQMNLEPLKAFKKNNNNKKTVLRKKTLRCKFVPFYKPNLDQISIHVESPGLKSNCTDYQTYEYKDWF